jgi:hypothetical protein
MLKFAPFQPALVPGGRSIVKNLFQREAVDEVLRRIDTLQPASPKQWGKMHVGQMMAHCSAVMDMATGQLNPPRMLIGRLIGPFFKPMFINEKPTPRNAPTDKQLAVADARDFFREQELLKQKIRQFHEGGEARCTRHAHPFFGPLTAQEWGRGTYKHLDHHLSQFGA